MKIVSSLFVAGLAVASIANPALDWRGDAPDSVVLRGLSASGTFSINLENAEHWDLQGDGNNQILLVDVNAVLGGAIGGAATMTGIGWDVSVSTAGGSWLSEATYYFDDNIAPDFAGLYVTPGVGNDFAGEGVFSSAGIDELSDIGVPDIVLPDGVVRIELFDNFDDFANAIDAFSSGELIIAADYTLKQTGCNPADLSEPFDVLDLSDINVFITGFVAQDPIADLDENGIYDLADINLFINAFVLGCP